MPAQNRTAVLFQNAINEISSLIALMILEPAAQSSRSAPFFGRSRDRLAALPLSRSTHALLLNQVADSESLLGQSEPGAASFQLNHTMRRLIRLQAERSTDGPR